MLILSIILLILVVIIIIVVIYTCQNYFIFQPVITDYVPNEIKVNKYISCRAYNKDNNNVMMYCHGISGNITQIEDFKFDDWCVFYWDYPGFGNSKGKMSPDSYFKSALDVYDYLYQRYKKIVVYGYSFGSGIAAYVAMMRQPDALILEAPYYDFKTLLSEKVSIISLLSIWNIETYKYIEHYDKPIYKLHGIYDNVIPYYHSVALKGTLITFEDDHSSLKKNPRWNYILKEILNSL